MTPDLAVELAPDKTNREQAHSYSSDRGVPEKTPNP